MRIALAFFSLLLVGGIAYFTLYRSGAEDAAPSGVTPERGMATAPAAETSELLADDQIVKSAAQPVLVTEPPAPVVAPPPVVAAPQVIPAPTAQVPYVKGGEIDLASGQAIGIVSPVAEPQGDGEFSAKYAKASDDDLRGALDDLRRHFETIGDGKDMTPETLAALKRELSWLESRIGS